MATARSPVKVPCENEDLPEKENAPEFDEDTLQAAADVYRNEGNEAFKKGDFISAIHFYSKGIKMNCIEKELKAKLHNNRAIAHFKLGNHQNSLRDAEAAIELNPTFLKAIVRGATACVELKRFKEGITWCDKGLATNETCEALKERYLMSNIPKRNLASGYHILKKVDQPSWRTTRRNYKHIPQIVYISSRFRALHLLSWEFERSEVL